MLGTAPPPPSVIVGRSEDLLNLKELLTKQTTALTLLGDVYFRKNEPAKAIIHYDESLEISRQLGGHRDEGLLLSKLGKAHCVAGEYNYAIKFFQQALVAAQEIGHRRCEAEALFDLGVAYYGSRDREAAIAHASKAAAKAFALPSLLYSPPRWIPGCVTRKLTVTGERVAPN